MNMLAIDVPIENLSDVLEDLDHSCGALRRVRDTLTNEEGWDHDRRRMIKAVIDQGLLLASVIRHSIGSFHERPFVSTLPGQLDHRPGRRPESGSCHRPNQACAEVEDDPGHEERGPGRALYDAP